MSLQPARDHRMRAQERLGRWQIEGYSRIVAERREDAGGNPISIRLRRKDLQEPVVQSLLRASYEAGTPGAEVWSDANSPVVWTPEPAPAPTDETAANPTG